MDLCTKSQTGGCGAVKIEGGPGKAAMKRFRPRGGAKKLSRGPLGPEGPPGLTPTHANYNSQHPPRPDKRRARSFSPPHPPVIDSRRGL